MSDDGDAVRRSCYRKARHATRQIAEAIVGKMRRKERSAERKKRLVAYECEHCGGFHVGHLPK